MAGGAALRAELTEPGRMRVGPAAVPEPAPGELLVAPVELGAGSRLWNTPEELLERYHRDVVPSPSGVVHHLFWRR